MYMCFWSGSIKVLKKTNKQTKKNSTPSHQPSGENSLERSASQMPVFSVGWLNKQPDLQNQAGLFLEIKSSFRLLVLSEAGDVLKAGLAGDVGLLLFTFPIL